MCSVCSSGQWSGGGSPPAWSRFADLELSFSFYVQGILARRSLRLCGILVALWLGCGGAWWWQPLYFQYSSWSNEGFIHLRL
ncbi:unnamed protein product [Brassica oleracea]